MEISMEINSRWNIYFVFVLATKKKNLENRMKNVK